MKKTIAAVASAAVKGMAMPTDQKTFAYNLACPRCGKSAFYSNGPAKITEPVSAKDWYSDQGVHPTELMGAYCPHCIGALRFLTQLVSETNPTEAQVLSVRYADKP